jgi:UDP-N-acetylglucosamine/UDP-N-acetylgalactosamine diphosphorylase
MDADSGALRQSFEKAGQGHVFARWDSMGERARRRLVRQLQNINLAQLPAMQAAVAALHTKPARNLAPAETFGLANEEFPYVPATAAGAVAPLGERALQRGQVAVLLVAGGQGTRLGFDGPKGCYPVLPISGMTLFEVFARKLIRVGRTYGKTPPLYGPSEVRSCSGVMTPPVSPSRARYPATEQISS